MFDPPPPDLKPEVKAKYSDRYEEHVTNSTYYLFMNTRVPPFDKKEVREAVNYGIDKPALARLFAGELAPGCSFLPPGMPGYDEALDVEDCPWGDPNEPPDLEQARQMITDAGAEGAEVTVWGDTLDPDDEVAEAYADMLNKIGLDAKPKILDAGVFFQTIGNAKTEAQTGVDELVPGLPAPEELLLPGGRQVDPADQQPELRQRRRSRDHLRDRRAEQGAGADRRGRRQVGRAEQAAGRGGLDRPLRPQQASPPSCRSGWTSRTARYSTRSTTTTTRASVSSRSCGCDATAGGLSALDYSTVDRSRRPSR